MSRKKAVFIQATGGYANTIISIIRGLLLLPIYLEFIDLATYGAWVSIYSLVILLSVVNFGVSKMAIQRMSKSFGLKNYQQTSDYFISSLLIYVIVSIVYLVASIVVFINFEILFKIPIDNIIVLKRAFLIALFSTMLSFFNDAIRGFSQAILRPFVAVLSTNISRIISIMFILGYVQKIGILVIPISMMIVEVCSILINGIYYFYQLIKLKIKIRFSKIIMKEYFHLSPMLFGSMIGNNLYTKSQPIIIMMFLGPEIVASYDITTRILNILFQMLNVFNVSLIGPFSHLVGEGNTVKIRETMIVVLKMSFLLSLFTFGMYAICNSVFITLWVGKDIVLSNTLINFMSIGIFFSVINRLIRNLLFGIGHIKISSNIMLIEGILFTSLAYVLTKVTGIIGLPVAISIVSVLETMLIGIIIIHKSKIKVDRNTVLKICFLFCLISVGVLLFQNIYFFYTVNWKQFISIAAISVIYLLLIIFLFERKFIIIFLRYFFKIKL